MTGLSRRSLDRKNSLLGFSRGAQKTTLTFSHVTAPIGTAPVKGTVVTDQIMYRRLGDTMEIHAAYYQSAAGTNPASGLLVAVPGSYEIDSSKQYISSTFDRTKAYSVVGQGVYINPGSAAQAYLVWVQAYSTTQLGFIAVGRQIADAEILGDGLSILGAEAGLTFTARVPIVGWK